MNVQLKKFVPCFVAFLFASSAIFAEDRVNTNSNEQSVQTRKIAPANSIPFRASTLVGMNVRNGEDKVIGAINDFVVDLSDQKIRYLAVSYGGFLGLGDKLFAVPAGAFAVRRDTDTDTHYLVLDIPESQLKSAPGFDQNHWPDVADSKWQKEVNSYYQKHSTNSK